MTQWTSDRRVFFLLFNEDKEWKWSDGKSIGSSHLNSQEPRYRWTILRYECLTKYHFKAAAAVAASVSEAMGNSTKPSKISWP